MSEPVRLDQFMARACADRPAVLADLDGCLMARGALLPHAAELVARIGRRLWIVSNNSTDTAESLSQSLARLGAPIAADRILLAGEQTLLRLAADRPGARIALFAAPRLHQVAAGLGLRVDRRAPELAVLARDTGFGFEDLAALAALAHRGLPVLLTNPDGSHPGPDGAPVPETGALLAALRATGPVTVLPGAGKPAADLPRAALSRAGVAPGDAVLIGDTPDTDGAAARAAGIEFVLIARPGAALAKEGAAC